MLLEGTRIPQKIGSMEVEEEFPSQLELETLEGLAEDEDTPES